MKILSKIFAFLKSLRLAVILILAMAVLSTVGTIYEAKYDAQYAQAVVYHSPWMIAVMIILCINLIAVMVDRWPWQKRHTGFLLAHIGIILTLIGAYITQQNGIDGSIAFGIGESSRYISITQRELSIWAGAPDGQMTQLARADTDFLKKPPHKKAFTLQVGDNKLEVLDYYHYAVRDAKIVPSTRASDGPAIRIQLQNENVDLTEWIVKPEYREQAVTELGPARIVLTKSDFYFDGNNTLVLKPISDGELEYRVFTKSKMGLSASGRIKEGEVVDTGWMGLKLRLLRFLPKGEEQVTYIERETPSKVTSSAIKIRFNGDEQWMGLNSVLRFFTENQLYMVRWGNKRIDMGFPMQLVNFNIGHYQGTRRAASYESQVQVPDLDVTTISMNEPLQYRGFTFYQASYEQDEMGKPTASVLSVNHDPGRFLKYLGCLIIVFGSIMLFYFKKFGQKKKDAR